MKLPIPRPLLFFLFAAFVCSPLPAQTIGASADDGEVLTRGPVHEAFAGVVNFRPEAGLIVDRAPPEAIEELPPEERPADGDAAWIPGYWGWDDERNDFIWISGTWRVLPPGRAWIAGYWRDTGRGWQWVSGYWEEADRREVVYLNPPPETLERGPSSPAPSPDYEWAPGCWEWRDERYLWRPGYWIEGRADWVWIPSYYVWTPRGYVFVEGYWDFAPEERGLLFAPVYYREHRRSRYEYRPSIVWNVAILADYLFLRPRYSHYYFGDYYDARYESSGFYATFAYQSSRGGYDPFYSYSRWEHRDDRDWDRQYRASYDYRRRNTDARPPRTWSGSALTVNVNVNQGGAQIGGARRGQAVSYAQPVQQYAQAGSGGIRLERAARSDSQQQVQVARQIQEQRTQRRTTESQGARTAPGPQSSPAPRPSTSGGQSSVASQAVARAALPVSPIVARPDAGGRQPPPRAQGSRLDNGTPSRETAPSRSSGAIGATPNQSTQSQRDARQAPSQRGTNPESVIGGSTAPDPRNEPARSRDRAEPTDNSRRQEERTRQQEQRQVEDAARRNVAQPSDQIGMQPREQPSPGAAERERQRADEQRRAVGAPEPADQPQPEANRARDEQRRDQERQAQQQQGEQEQRQQQQRQREQAQQRQAQQTDERQQQAREQQAKAAEQAQAREQQSRAEEDRGRRAAQAEQERAQQQQEQAREQQSRGAEQAREREAQAAEQARSQQQQAQSTEQARAQEAQSAQQAREQQAKPAPQPDPRQKGQPNRQKAQPPPPKKEPPKDQPDNPDDDERKKGKG